MATMVAPISAPARVVSSPRVVTCYDFFDRVFPECGLVDLTEGIYHGDPATPYEVAQSNQHEWLLDEARCVRGSRILDIGCGNGALLAAAKRRGAKATGITISPAQVERCRSQGLDVRLLNYRAIPDSWTGQFDAIIANGSMEHFVRPQDVAEGVDDALYQELFEICQRLLNPNSPSARMVTTVIHRNQFSPVMTPEEVERSPLSHEWFSLEFHTSMLQRGFGGWYPAPGQLARCARPCFELVESVDGTQDYHWTSETWFNRVKASLKSWRHGPRLMGRLAKLFARHPLQTMTLTFGLLVAESWQWQFRGEHPPATLWRHVWQRRNR